MILTCILNFSLYGQNSVSIGTEDINEDAVLQLVSPDNDQGFLAPRMNTAQRQAMSPQEDDNGLLVYDYEQSQFYYWHDGQWFSLANGASLTITGTGATIIRGTYPNLVIHTNPNDTSATNEIQDLELNDNILTITKNSNANEIDLSSSYNNTDEQNLYFDPVEDSLTIDNGVGVDLSDLVDDEDADTTNEIQDLMLNYDILTITNHPNPSNIDLSGYRDNTDEQNLHFDPVEDSLTIDNGMGVDLSDLVDDEDADTTNEIQDLTLDSHVLTITNHPNPNAIDLSRYMDNTDKQNLYFDPVEDSLTIDNGQGVDLSDLINDADADTTNEIITYGALINDELQIAEGEDTIKVSLGSYGWKLTGNTGTDDVVNFIGTTDEVGLNIRTNNQNRIQISSTGNIGIGTNPGNNRIHVAGDVGGIYVTATSGTGVYATSGNTIALRGINESNRAPGVYGMGRYGVMGYGVSESYTAYGAAGRTNSSVNNSAGVYGEALNSAGNTWGVYGRTRSQAAGVAGVYGTTTYAGTINYGVHGISVSQNGAGVRGEATNTTDNIYKYGVYGTAAGNRGVGVYGSGNFGIEGYCSRSGGIGVYGRISQPNGYGIRGVASNSATGTKYGVYGYASSNGGYNYGVYGSASGSSGDNYGVYGYANGGSSRGVYGQGYTGVYGSGSWCGVFGTGTNYGMYAVSSGSSGGDIGLYARTSSTAGNDYAIYAVVTTTNGVNYGIYASAPTSEYAGYFNGYLYGTHIRYISSFGQASDKRLKKNIVKIDGALSSLQKMNGVYFNWNTEKYPEREFGEERQIGVIAQDIEQVYPEIVFNEVDGFKTVDYTKLGPILIEAVKEQQEIIENQEKKIEELNARIEKIEEMLKEQGVR